MSAPVDVLADLRKIADGEGDAELLAMRAHAAIAELMEADEAYDDALAAYKLCESVRKWHSPATIAELSKNRRNARALINATKVRRAAALRAVGGAK